MGYVLKAVLSSAQHPEYGQITVPFPIPDEKYDRMIELLEPLEIGDALRQDCRVDELDSFYTVLNRLVGSLVNFDELDYLAKRLDSFDDGEAAQFQGMACKLGVSNIKDFINLTFCCQQATVITDFSDLDAIGRQHYMTMQGGGCRIEELERLDGRKFALDLILNHLEGRITPYGVVYDNGMKLEQLYDGRHFPCYDEEWAAEDNKFRSVTSFTASRASLRELRDYLADTLKYARIRAEWQIKAGELPGGWFDPKDWDGWQKHMEGLIHRLDGVLALEGSTLELAHPPAPTVPELTM